MSVVSSLSLTAAGLSFTLKRTGNEMTLTLLLGPPLLCMCQLLPVLSPIRFMTDLLLPLSHSPLTPP